MAKTAQSATTQPGYRRTIAVEPRDGAVLAMLEDDIHCLAVILRHDGQRVLGVEAFPHRMPWNTCPGSAGKLAETFEGQLLEDVTARREKKQNCTHFHDLAVLAAAHSGDAGGFVYDIAASDPVEGQRLLEIRRNDTPVHRWIESDGILEYPDGIQGLSLMTMRDWIGGLEGVEQEAARALQWASLVAHGRTMSFDKQSRAVDLPPNCYTFQPQRAAIANRDGDRFDFSDGSRVPLADIRDKMIFMLESRALPD